MNMLARSAIELAVNLVCKLLNYRGIDQNSDATRAPRQRHGDAAQFIVAQFGLLFVYFFIIIFF